MAESQSRFGLALDFACAAVTVLLSGRVADEAIKASANSAIRPYYDALPEFLTRIPHTEFLAGGKYWGAFKRVGQSLGVSHTLVSNVAKGNSKSTRVLDALIAEISRVDRENDEPPPPPLTKIELSDFRRGKRYHGVYARVAQALGKDRSWVTNIGRGEVTTRSSHYVLKAIRVEMARVDAEALKAKVDA